MIIFDELLPLPPDVATTFEAYNLSNPIIFPIASGNNPISLTFGRFLTLSYQITNIDMVNIQLQNTIGRLTVVGGSSLSINVGNITSLGENADMYTHTAITDSNDLGIYPEAYYPYNVDATFKFIEARYWGVL